jgi:hypothetical protein
MTRGVVTVARRHIGFLLERRREAKERIVGVRNQLRALGADSLADDLSAGLQALGEVASVIRAMSAAAEGGTTLDEALREAEQRSRRREVA